MRPRCIGRRLAFQYLFMADLQGYENVESPFDFFRSQREAAVGESDEPGFKFDDPDPRRDEAEMFANALIDAALKSRADIDARIGKAADNWTVARMGTVERNVIRLALAELDLGGTPPGVVADEAVELAKRFGDKESGAFVNGVVDRAAKSGFSGKG